MGSITAENSQQLWFFTDEDLNSTPSIKCGYEPKKEVYYRQHTANFIQLLGRSLKLSELCINTAIVYMQRFYMFHSFTDMLWDRIALAALFLSTKEEDHRITSAEIITMFCILRHKTAARPDVDTARRCHQELIQHEKILLVTLRFDLQIEHPHEHVTRGCRMLHADQDLREAACFLVCKSLSFTTMCVQYRATVVACVCIYLACKWTGWEIPKSSEGKEWYEYIDPTVDAELLQKLTHDYVTKIDCCQMDLKQKIMYMK